ncbi:hypothetical protein NMYAN_130020 [Nitrosomonas nitrosa]|uniref:Uncharacterized protein n=1 Tax=Nitrosomonas nitrosa TaxID=52442 RepID=A0A8H9D8N6_9PROT|nr:hypothetical protein NMYAN_130020 [Nitrosomonas nitrosa]
MPRLTKLGGPKNKLGDPANHGGSTILKPSGILYVNYLFILIIELSIIFHANTHHIQQCYFR